VNRTNTTYNNYSYSGNTCAGAYRSGFNGKEKDDEIYGNGNAYDFGARMYDSRLGRWLSCDPQYARYTSLSPYAAFANNPNYYIDPGGETLEVSGSKALARRFLRHLNRESDVKFKLKDGQVVLKNPDAKATGEYSKQMIAAINDNQTVNLRLVRDKKSFGVDVDDYDSGRLDYDDITAGSSNTFKQNLIHVLAERFGSPNYEENKNNNEDPMLMGAYGKGHKLGTEAEARFLQELYPDKDIQADPLAEGIIDEEHGKFNRNGKGTVDIIYDFGDVILRETIKATKNSTGQIHLSTTATNWSIEVKKDEKSKKDEKPK